MTDLMTMAGTVRRRRYHGRKTTPERIRFDAKWTPEPNTGCWLWTGAHSKAEGYGSFAQTNPRRQVWAHRKGWELYRGPIPDGMFIDHVCRVRSCVNPDHLRVVTPAQNNTENSTSPTARNKTKETCPRCGGEYSPNTKGRKCRRCYNEYQRSRRAAQRPTRKET